MGIRDRAGSGSGSALNLINFTLRVLQLVLAIAIVGFYSVYASNKVDAHFVKLTLPIVTGALSILTAIAFAVTPLLVSYYFVAIVFLWDWVLFFLWCAVFGYMNKTFIVAAGQEGNHGGGGLAAANEERDLRRFQSMVWVDLAAMLLWLVSAIMGPVCLLMDRKSLRSTRAVV